jgi:16S rRNA (adenine1518-N6/adenine1519-N6)-dimethyltransferase
VADCGMTAIEKDAELAGRLAERLAKARPDGKSASAGKVRVIQGDALTILPSLAPASPEEKYKIVGNIPYYLTGHLLRAISELAHTPERCVFMVQKEVAERVDAQPPHMNRLAASVQFWAAPKIIEMVGKQNFVPQPKVDSAILLLESVRRSGKDKSMDKNILPAANRYYAAVRALFAQPRKTILNNLAAMQGEQGEKTGKEAALRVLQAAGIDPALRPQNLTIENIAAIAAQIR